MEPPAKTCDIAEDSVPTRLLSSTLPRWFEEDDVTTSKPRSFVVPDWISGYRKDWLRPDVIAGLTTAAVVIPKAMAYATIAGLPVQVGLYTAFLPMVIYAVLGTSRPLSVSTTTTLAILTAAELGEVAPGGDPASLL